MSKDGRKFASIAAEGTALAACLGLRVLLQARMPVTPGTLAPDDDLLMARYAQKIIQMKWLGRYELRTLEKPPGYAVYAAIGNWLDLPYMLWFGLLIAAVSLVFYLGIRKLAGRAAAWAAFLPVLFWPVNVASAGQRFYNLAPVAALVVLTAAGYAGLIAERANGRKAQGWWMAAASFGYAAFSVVRFDTIWLALFAGAASAVLFLAERLRLRAVERSAARRVFGFIGAVIFFALPFLCAGVFRAGLSAANRYAYGVFEADDFNSGPFAETCKQLMRIAPEEEQPACYVDRASLEKAYAVSPALAELKPVMDSILADTEHQALLASGDPEREYYAWMLRAAAAISGKYADAKTSDAFFSQAERELKAAFDAGLLPERKALVISPFTGPLTADRAGEIFRYLAGEALSKTIRFAGLSSAYTYAQEDEAWEVFAAVTKEDLLSAERGGTETEARAKAGAAAGNRLIGVFRLLWIPLAALSAAVFLVWAVRLPWKLRDDPAKGWRFLLAAGCLLACLADLFVVGANFFRTESGTFENVWFYAAGGSMFYGLFAAVCLGEAARACAAVRSARHK